MKLCALLSIAALVTLLFKTWGSDCKHFSTKLYELTQYESRTSVYVLARPVMFQLLHFSYTVCVCVTHITHYERTFVNYIVTCNTSKNGVSSGWKL